MYNGIIKAKGINNYVINTKIQVVEPTEIENNGVIVSTFKVKTKDFKGDPRIKVSDFNILNLQRIGALGQLKPTQLPPDIAQMSRNADAANEMIDQINLFKEIENERNQTPSKDE